MPSAATKTFLFYLEDLFKWPSSFRCVKPERTTNQKLQGRDVVVLLFRDISAYLTIFGKDLSCIQWSWLNLNLSSQLILSKNAVFINEDQFVILLDADCEKRPSRIMRVPLYLDPQWRETHAAGSVLFTFQIQFSAQGQSCDFGVCALWTKSWILVWTMVFQWEVLKSLTRFFPLIPDTHSYCTYRSRCRGCLSSWSLGHAEHSRLSWLTCTAPRRWSVSQCHPRSETRDTFWSRFLHWILQCTPGNKRQAWWSRTEQGNFWTTTRRSNVGTICSPKCMCQRWFKAGASVKKRKAPNCWHLRWPRVPIDSRPHQPIIHAGCVTRDAWRDAAWRKAQSENGKFFAVVGCCTLCLPTIVFICFTASHRRNVTPHAPCVNQATKWWPGLESSKLAVASHVHAMTVLTQKRLRITLLAKWNGISYKRNLVFVVVHIFEEAGEDIFLWNVHITQSTTERHGP